MRQTLHIMQKDARYLWREIGLVLALAAIFAWINPWWMTALLLAAAAYLIARLVHAEAIPGDRQFWITRPYGWSSLLAAKLLFVAIFVNLPILLAQLRIVAAGGFPLASSLPGLLWSQFLMLLVGSVPIAALAAMTRGTVSFIFAALILVTTWFVMQVDVWFSPERRPSPWPMAIEWIRDTLAVAALALVVSSILWLQYRRRRTFLSRAIALAGIALIAAVYWSLPWQSAWAVQSRLSRQPIAASALQVSVNSIRFSPRHARTWENVEISMPISVSSIPNGVELKADGLALVIQAADGRTWKSRVGGARRQSSGRGGAVIDTTTIMSLDFFRQELGQPVIVRGSLYLTLFGNRRTQTIPLQENPVNALDGLQCYLGAFHQFFCRSASRWPARLVYAQFGTVLSPVTQSISYSPFPGGLHLDPIDTRWAPSGPSSGGEVTIVVEEPLAHLRRDFELRGVRLTAAK